MKIVILIFGNLKLYFERLQIIFFFLKTLYGMINNIRFSK